MIIKYWRYATILALAACGTPVLETTPDLKTEAQQALTGVTSAIVAGDMERFLQYYQPEPGEPENMAAKLLETQRGGILSHYGEEGPQIVDARKESIDVVSVSTYATKFHMMSPKRVFFRRGADGKLRWMGVVSRAKQDELVGPDNQLHQAAIYSCPAPAYGETCADFDMLNNEYTFTHAFRGQSQMVNVPEGCPTACWNTSVAPWYYTVHAGESNSHYWTMACKQSGSQCAINLVSPTYADCTCSADHVTRASGYCAWIHAFGWDLYWNPGAGDINVLPSLGAAGSCP